MDENYWRQKWAVSDIKFHRNAPNPHLVEHWSNLKPGHAFVPFCGKSLDLLWLLSKGWKVTGSEWSGLACESFFTENKIAYTTRKHQGFTIYSGDRIDIWCGNHFKLDVSVFHGINAWYDRAAIVALPEETRTQYATFLNQQSQYFSKECFELLLLCFEYDQSKVMGPPFSVEEKEVRAHFSDHFAVELIKRVAELEINNNAKLYGIPVNETVIRLKLK